jgi:hypothetical protein
VQPACIVYNTTNQSIPNTTATMLAFNAERVDNDGMHDNATNNTRITCRTAGTYVVTVSVIFAVSATGVRVLQVVHSTAGGVIWQSQNAVTAAANTTRLNAAGTIDLLVGEYIEAQVIQTSGGALDSVAVTVPSGLAPIFAAVRVA